LLDAGAVGIIVPVVESAESFATFIQHLNYPPAGRRGVGLSRANLWGDTFKEYLDGFAPVIIPQIETVRGVAAAPAIAALPEVDALFLGPYDLSADLGHPGDFTHPQVTEAMAQVRLACASHGKVAGIHQVQPDPAELRARLKEGYGFIAYGTDIIALRTALGRPLSILGESS
jgi:2-keto-3-deoxy-L-rhamnonate aldolase RhmA